MSNNQNNDTDIDIKTLQDQLTVARREIANLRQQIKSLGYVHQKECESLRQTVTNWKCNDCRQKVSGCTSDTETATEAIEAYNTDEIPMKIIGTITTHFPEKRGTPRQPGISPESVAKLTLKNSAFTNPEHALEGLQEFSHMWVIFYFHRNDSTHTRAKVAPPRLNGIRTGVFATRSPHRPSPIGLSLVKIDKIEDCSIYFSGVDMVDQTPVLDIKPYIPVYDTPSSGIFEVNNTVQSSSLNAPLSSYRHIDGVSTSLDDAESTCDDDHSLILPPINDSLINNPPQSNSLIGEREAPDGEEGDQQQRQTTQPIPPASTSSSNNNIRVPNWINESPVSELQVNFSERALKQLQTVKGEQEWKQTHTIISNVLRQDPRSVYLRMQYNNQFFTFKIAELHVSCKFDDNAHSVTVYQVRHFKSNDQDE